MQIKSKKILIYIYLLIFVLVNSNLNAEEFNISAKDYAGEMTFYTNFELE